MTASNLTAAEIDKAYEANVTAPLRAMVAEAVCHLSDAQVAELAGVAETLLMQQYDCTDYGYVTNARDLGLNLLQVVYDNGEANSVLGVDSVMYRNRKKLSAQVKQFVDDCVDGNLF